jgi:hypothetical protein
MEESSTISIFANLVREFCDWAEGQPKSEEEEVHIAINLLASLYSGALSLPNHDAGEDIEEEAVSDGQWKVIYRRFGALPFNYYLEFFSPAKLDDDEHVTGDLADDLADIYRDLKEGLSLYDLGHRKEAVWDWKSNFYMHWGRHASSALHALHCYAQDEGLWDML